MENQNSDHSHFFALETIQNAQADLNEAQRLIERSIQKLSAITWTEKLQRQLSDLSRRSLEIDAQVETLQRRAINEPGKIVPIPITKAEGYELGLFSGE